MEGPSNGGMLYHEVQESKLCAVHCVNTVLQGPFFSEFDLAALASDLDRTEQQMMSGAGPGAGDFLPDQSHNVSMDGDFSIQVLQKALEVWALQVIPLNSPVAEPAQIDPEIENAFICHLQDHWFCIRKVNGEWYNFDSLYAAPEHLSKFYLSAYLDSLKEFGWSIFLVRGNYPKECPISSSEASNGYGQWLLPEDAERIIKSRSTVQRPPQRSGPTILDAEEDDEDLNAAIAASLRDSSPARIVSSPATVGLTADDLNAAIAASLRGLSPAPSPARVEFTSDDLNAAIAASLRDPPPVTAASSPGLPPVSTPETSSGEAATSINETKSSPGRNI